MADSLVSLKITTVFFKLIGETLTELAAAISLRGLALIVALVAGAKYCFDK